MSRDDIRILIIDDEVSIRDTLRLQLGKAGYKVLEADSAASGLRHAQNDHPHLILLDLGLPDRNGLEVLKELRRWTQIPVVVLTVTDEERTKVALLDAGADDYLTKPFGPAELLARLRVSLRHGLKEATPLFRSGDLEVDVNAHRVAVKGAEVKLTNTEFEVLRVLVREQGKVVPQAQLLREVWAASTEDQSHYLRIYVKQLRKKLEENPSVPKHIITEPGVGYRLV